MAYTYPKPKTFRLDDDALAIIQRIRDTGEPGRAVSSTDAVVIALHFWAKHNPDLSRFPDGEVERGRSPRVFLSVLDEKDNKDV